MVYVLSRDGKPLMPTERHGKVRHLLNDGKAKVVRREPFTIKLLYETTEYTQDITLGVDTGSGTLGTAAVKDDGTVVYMSEVTVRNDIRKRMMHPARNNRCSSRSSFALVFSFRVSVKLGVFDFPMG
jgi:hypothetical protein